MSLIKNLEIMATTTFIPTVIHFTKEVRVSVSLKNDPMYNRTMLNGLLKSITNYRGFKCFHVVKDEKTTNSNPFSGFSSGSYCVDNIDDCGYIVKLMNKN